MRLGLILILILIISDYPYLVKLYLLFSRLLFSFRMSSKKYTHGAFFS